MDNKEENYEKRLERARLIYQNAERYINLPEMDDEEMIAWAEQEPPEEEQEPF